MIRDAPSWQLPPEALYDSLNLLYDQPRIARQRGGSTALVSGAQTAFATSLGFCYSQDGTPIEELYGLDGKAGGMNVISKTTGAATSLGAAIAADSTVGRPVRHFGWLFWPVKESTGLRTSMSASGETASTAFSNNLAVTMTAGNQQVTLTGADVTTNIKVGASAVGKIVGLIQWHGRVVSVDTTKLFTVWPKPTTSFSFSGIGDFVTTPFHVPGAPTVNVKTGGACVTSFQNRLLYGNSSDLTSISSTLVCDRRVIYSPLPTEEVAGVSLRVYGAAFTDALGWPPLSYFEVPGSDPIVAMEPLQDNELLILTSTHPVIFRGNLTTQLATTSPTITWDLAEVNEPAGCLSDLSVQRTKRGIVWAGPGGVYAFDGRGITNLCGDDKTKRIASYWRSLASDAATFVIHGSSYVRDHYIVSGTSGGTTFSLMCNMANLQWTRLSGVGTDNFFSVARPSIPQQVFGLRWWDQAGAAPSMTNGQTLRLDSMGAPYVAGATKTDADGTAVAVSLTTPTITGGNAETQKMPQRCTVRHQQASTTAAMTVTAQSVLDAADTDASRTRTLGSLSNTSTLTVSAATNASPIVITTGTHGLQDDDWVEIDAVAGNTNANGRWRIDVLSTTTFALLGSTGNAAYTSGGKVKKLTETDFAMGGVNKGQGVSLTISGSPNNFEYHGATIAALVAEPVMSAG